MEYLLFLVAIYGFALLCYYIKNTLLKIKDNKKKLTETEKKLKAAIECIKILEKEVNKLSRKNDDLEAKCRQLQYKLSHPEEADKDIPAWLFADDPMIALDRQIFREMPTEDQELMKKLEKTFCSQSIFD